MEERTDPSGKCRILLFILTFSIERKQAVRRDPPLLSFSFSFREECQGLVSPRTKNIHKYPYIACQSKVYNEKERKRERRMDSHAHVYTERYTLTRKQFLGQFPMIRYTPMRQKHHLLRDYTLIPMTQRIHECKGQKASRTRSRAHAISLTASYYVSFRERSQLHERMRFALHFAMEYTTLLMTRSPPPTKTFCRCN